MTVHIHPPEGQHACNNNNELCLYHGRRGNMYVCDGFACPAVYLCLHTASVRFQVCICVCLSKVKK